MEQILKDINAVVGVTGTFVCDDEGQILAKALPSVFDEALLSPVGRTMAQTIAGLKITRRRKVGDIDLLFDQGRLIVKSVGDGCLCILCVHRINVPLLNLTANLAARKLQGKMKEAKTQATVRKPAPQPEPPPEPAPLPGARAETDSVAEVEAEAEVEPEAEPPRRLTLAEIMAANIRR